MSYLVNATANIGMTGGFNTTYTLSNGLTLAAWVRTTSGHTWATGTVASIGTSSTTLVGAQCIRTGAAVNGRVTCRSFNNAGVQVQIVNKDVTRVDDVWRLLVGRFRYLASGVQREVFFVDETSPGQGSTVDQDYSTMQYVSLLTDLDGGADMSVGFYIAEAAMWSSYMSDVNVALLYDSLFPTSVDASNLIGYWPLDTDNTTQTNEAGKSNAGDLTVAGGTNLIYSTEHPSLTAGAGVSDITLSQQPSTNPETKIYMTWET